MYLFKVICLIIFFSLTLDVGLANDNGKAEPIAVIEGQVIDTETESPIVGVNVLMVGTKRIVASDSAGYFRFEAVVPGEYRLRLTHVAYRTRVVSIDLSDDSSAGALRIELESFIGKGGHIRVISRLEHLMPRSAVGCLPVCRDEIEHAVVPLEDLGKVLFKSTALSIPDDRFNSLIIRGGNPMENRFVVDDVEFPNINHYPSQGSAVGAFGLLDLDLVSDFRLYTAGYGVSQTDCLSSVMQIRLRRGNRQHLAGICDLSLGGFGVSLEGPLPGHRGGWIISGRRGFYDILDDLVNLDMKPSFHDVQLKMDYELLSGDYLTGLAVIGRSDVEFTRDAELSYGRSGWGYVGADQQVFGLTWNHLWCQNNLLRATFSRSAVSYRDSSFSRLNGQLYYLNKSRENTYVFSLDNIVQITDHITGEFGGRWKIYDHDINYWFRMYSNQFYFRQKSLETVLDERFYRPEIYAGVTVTPRDRLTVSTGLGYDHYTYNDNNHIYPRFSFAYEITDRTMLSGAFGLYYQPAPMIYMAMTDETRRQSDPEATHWLLGMKHRLHEEGQISLEFYRKSYRHMPLDSLEPPLFLIDELVANYGLFIPHDNIVDSGQAYSQGLEFTYQARLSPYLELSLGGTVYVARYRGYDRQWYRRWTNNQTAFLVELRYAPNESWSLGMIWRFSGGTPYVPIDTALSRINGRTYYDLSQTNLASMPDYHTLNVRFDKVFKIGRARVNLYIVLINVYNRKNVAFYYYSFDDQRVEAIYQLEFLPIAGIKFHW